MRNIISDIWADEFFLSLSPIERLLWIGIIVTCADDQGRFTKSLITIKIKIFPMDQVTPEQIDEMLNKFAEEKKLIIYEPGEKTFVQIKNWWKYQHTSEWMAKSHFPPPEGWIDFYRYHAKGNTIPKSDHWEDRHNAALGKNYEEPTYTLRSREGDVNDDNDGKGNSNDENEVEIKKTVATTSTNIQKVFQQVTGQTSIPTGQDDKQKILERVIAHFPTEEAAVSHLKEAYDAWIQTPRKNGDGNYSPLNLGWIEWADAALSGIKPWIKSMSRKPEIHKKRQAKRGKEVEQVVKNFKERRYLAS